MEVTVNASSLDDIDPAAIAQRLVNGTAVVASPVLSRLRTREDEHPDVVQRASSQELTARFKMKFVCMFVCG